jgi:hypothetical protein
MARFRKIELKIEKTHLYGRYYVSAKYKGQEIKTMISNSECYDWLNDESNKEKHQEAKRYAYKAIVSKYQTFS